MLSSAIKIIIMLVCLQSPFKVLPPPPFLPSSELANGVSSGDWNSSLFNGQLDGLDVLDPTTGMPGGFGDPQGPASSPPVSTSSQPVDRSVMS